jgi:hypothetical protein
VGYSYRSGSSASNLGLYCVSMGMILPYCCQTYGTETESFAAQSQSLAGA